MTQTRGKGIVIERTYSATPDELWSLWTTSDGFASWWGPVGFRADVHRMEEKRGGALHYDMVADTPEMVAAMKRMGQPVSQPVHGTFTEFEPNKRLVLTQTIDFFPDVPAYDSVIVVELAPVSDGQSRMTVTLHQMHDAETTRMQQEGFTSQLSKLDRRYGWTG